MYSDKVVLFGQMWLYSGKCKMVVFGQRDVFGQGGCIWAKLLYSGKSGCIRGKWLYSGKLIIGGQGGCIREKVVAFGQKWL